MATRRRTRMTAAECLRVLIEENENSDDDASNEDENEYVDSDAVEEDDGEIVSDDEEGNVDNSEDKDNVDHDAQEVSHYCCMW